MIENNCYSLEWIGTARCLWRYTVRETNESFDSAPPVFEIEEETMPFVPADIALSREPVTLPNGVTTYTYTASFAADPDLVLDVVFRVAPDNPVVRFQYRLTGAPGRTLTKASGDHNTAYLGLSLDDFPTCKEVRVSEFDEAIHSFRPTERPVPLRAFAHALTLMGPIVIAQDDEHALLVAYEHGSQVPDAFLQYHLAPDRTMTLQAVKGNYYDGQMFDDDDAYETLWFQFAVVAGDEAALAQQYRAFVLRYMTRNAESRQPYIFYNTWNYQERNRWWNGQTFLASMHQDRILAEIDVAHRMGIEVFVIDTGWYEKTGDWQVDRDRFPDALATVKERLDAYDMKLGLWFSPRKAAVSSRIVQEHEDCRMMWQGEVSAPRPVWETEASFDMCLVSRYWEAFADQLIRLVEELGVTYFKWDAIHQYGCDAPHHFHGTEANTPQERADCYAFELGRYMTRIVDRVCAACPEAIVDFDITEGHRSVGLGFLSAGKYFLINNGPYYRSLDDPQYAPGGGMGANVFVFPGPARARLCRKPLDYDKWIPSVLFLTHYLPDDPASSQMINLASLMLGQNGIWGDLLKVSDEGVARFAKVLGLYKQVREDVTRSTPVRTGIVGGSPEIHEKIADETGRGLVAVFAEAAGTYTYITAHRVVDTHWATEGISVARDAAGRARLDVTFKEPGAHIVFFGVT